MKLEKIFNMISSLKKNSFVDIIDKISSHL